MAWLSTSYLGEATDVAPAHMSVFFAIPDEFRGRWAVTEELCREPDGPVEVRADGIDFAASAVRPVTATASADSFAFTSRTEEEGERIDEQIQLRRDDARLIIVRDGERQSYLACPRAAN
jgi:hypothetical protein